jgi:hypothetical protein
MNTISTTAVSKIIGLQVPVVFLKSLGFKPVFENTGGGAMWNEVEVDAMLMEMGLHFINKSKKIVDPSAPYGYKKNGEPSKKRGRPSTTIFQKEHA